MPKIEQMTLEEKVDELLVYQRKIHHMAILKTVFSGLTFLILVVLPVVGVYYLANHLTETIGLSLTEIGDTLKRVKSLTDLGGIDNLKNFLQ